MAEIETLPELDGDAEVTAAGAGAAVAEDTRSAAQRAATAHVDNWTPPKSTAEEAGEAEGPDLSGLKLPKTAKLTHALMQEVLSGEPKSQAEFDLKKAKLTAIRAHLFELEQGPKQPVLSVSAHQQIAATGSANADAIHLIELAKLHPEVKALLARNAVLEAGAKDFEIAKAIVAALAKAKDLAELKKTISDLNPD